MPQGSNFSAKRVTATLNRLRAHPEIAGQQAWLRGIAAHSNALRPDLAPVVESYLGVEPLSEDVFGNMSIGEIAVCYEAFLALSDSKARKDAGQYFTPDDAAAFMAQHVNRFPEGTWVDPCCGTGVLAWHLARKVDGDVGGFVAKQLILVDIDPVALHTAVVLLSHFLAPGDTAGFEALAARCVVADFLHDDIPAHDFVIMNPPYASTARDDTFATAATRDLFAYFMERVATTSRGFIAVTPASYLGAPKFAGLRLLVDEHLTGGDITVFDNVPDTLFRGYKFGSSNTSKTNFVRAAVTVCPPGASAWRVTPILRWRAASRAALLAKAPHLLAPRQIGPGGEWLKIHPDHQEIWWQMQGWQRTIADLVVPGPTEFSLTVATTPRYYISAAFGELSRRSKQVLHFATAHDRDLAAVTLNSSAPYLWWRWHDGGVSLTRRVLMSVPVPDIEPVLISDIRASERDNLVTKLNAGIINENVKHPFALVERLNRVVFGRDVDVAAAYAQDLTQAP
ncbi:N-6 DNA methylase [uncultured Corynebacterium sp.]|uniref:N-6 DNA methylase n=1 Tax=uncultured Corynebacterium sp. TaxID=159447 RepID=UPI002594881A|nr:N-6 DNA methylase [uncultured Corynebacterium sp.]